MKDKKDNISLTEIFMAKAGNDFSRCFHGTIIRDFDAKGNPFVFSRININQGFICSREKDQWILGESLDSLVLLVLDSDIHSCQPITSSICNELFYLN